MDVLGYRPPDPLADRAPLALQLARWRRTTVTGALLAGVLVGLQDALVDPRLPEVVLEVDDAGTGDGGEAVELELDPDRPAASRARVRPWLLAP